MDTTHPSNEEYDDDREAWRARILDFAAAAKFLQLVIYDSIPIDEETHSITWNARIKVLDGLVDERLVETKDFIERSLFVKDDGRWLYQGRPEEPRNVRVDGPLDPKPKPPKRNRAVSRAGAPGRGRPLAWSSRSGEVLRVYYRVLPLLLRGSRGIGRKGKSSPAEVPSSSPP